MMQEKPTNEDYNRGLGSIDYVHSLIRMQIKQGMPPDKIVVGGHGTGAFIAARAALSFPDAKLARIWMLNGFLGGPEAGW